MDENIDLQKLKEHPGKVRGVVFETDAKYVKKKFGAAGLEKLRQATKEFGWEIDFENIQSMGWYPIGQRAVSLLACQRAFGWTEKDIREMGGCAPKYSFIAAMMLKYFISLKRVFEEIPVYWKKHYTAGHIEPAVFDEKNRHMILRLKKFDVHPVLCQYYAGYFETISKYVIKSGSIKVTETQCNFKGGDFHEMDIIW